jgi:hypothetical protein
MKKTFQEEALQLKFEEVKTSIENFRKVVATETNLSDPSMVVGKLNLLHDNLHVCATSKAQITFLLEKHIVRKIGVTDQMDRTATEKKHMLSAEIGDVSFYDTFIDALIREAHYQIDILRSALSFIKAETKI